MLFKTLSIKKVFHVGTMNPKLRSSFNIEQAKGLSISTNPREWIRIGKGQIAGEFNSLFNPNARFALYNKSKELINTLSEYALDKGLVMKKQKAAVRYYDDEIEEEIIEYFESMSDAFDNFDEDADIENVEVLIPTNKLHKLMQPIRVDEVNPFRALFSLYVSEKYSDYDGVWHNPQEICVLKYQAPAGSIFDHKLKDWTQHIIEESELPDLIEEHIPKILTY
tara:strand:+ start:15348 stop:16016 length:669 start_codon:yes stop_codon:yes gene_type:complete